MEKEGFLATIKELLCFGSFVILCMSPSIVTICASIIFLFFVLFAQMRYKKNMRFGKTEKYYWAEVLFSAGYLGCVFYFEWKNSSVFQSLIRSLPFYREWMFPGICVILYLFSLLFLKTLFRWMDDDALSNKENEFAKRLDSAHFFIICMIIAGTGVVLQIIFSFSTDIWGDEAFSLAIIQHPYSDIVKLTAADVHPPLYYLILKFCVELVGKVSAVSSAITVGKLVSVLPYMCFILLAVRKVKKYWGNYVAGMWAVCMIGMQNLIVTGVEIRMYSWGMLFVTLAFLAVYEIMSKSNIMAWLLFAVFSLAAAYTHYFAGVAVGILYLFLLCYCIRKKKMLKQWILAAVVLGGGYLPWLIVFLEQLTMIRQDYWIAEIDIKTVFGYFGYLFGSSLFGIIALFLVAKAVRRKELNETVFFALSGIMVPVCVIVFGIFASILIRPVFVSRYILPGMACLWLGILILCKQMKKNFVKLILSVLIVCVSVLHMVSFATSEKTYWSQNAEIMSFFKANHDAVYVTDGSNSHISDLLELLSENECYTLGSNTNELFETLFPGLRSLNSADEIQGLMNEKQKIFYVAYEGGISVDQAIDDSSLKYEDVGRYRLETEIEIYRLTE